ncbi:MAG: hypothetical protein LBJ64_00055 [Deltaproteobacteria bacterium]|nr:hypothetical protein [Deltaproteobacteria bacterium]
MPSLDWPEAYRLKAADGRRLEEWSKKAEQKDKRKIKHGIITADRIASSFSKGRI